MKRFLLTVISAIALAGGGAALAQSHSGGGHSGGNGWHGNSNWHGGSGWHHSGWHGGSHFGVVVGFPGFYWGGYYPYYPYYGYPYYYGYPSYYPAPVYADPGPTTYIQQDDGGATQAPAPGGGYSYYCTDPAGYYPQVQNCPRGWLRVVPDAGPAPSPR